MNIMIIGSGGREHALAWKAAQSPQVDRIYVVPGNAGTAIEHKVENVALDPMDFSALTDFAKQKTIGLTIIGPEAPLVAGIVDYFTEQGLACFGPRQGAAQLEGSKAFISRRRPIKALQTLPGPLHTCKPKACLL